MQIQTLSDSANSIAINPSDSSETKKMKGACKDMEGLFLSMILKEGLKGMIDGGEEGGEDSGGHAGPIIETSLEQVANEMAASGSMGIANMLYRQVAASQGVKDEVTK
jgi:Rod binding domain-containing protein